MSASKFATVLQGIGKVAFILPTTVWLLLTAYLPTTPMGTSIKIIVFVFALHWLWKVVAFGILAKGFTGDHKVKCSICGKVVLPYASGLVIDMLGMMQKHDCKGGSHASE